MADSWEDFDAEESLPRVFPPETRQELGRVEETNEEDWCTERKGIEKEKKAVSSSGPPSVLLVNLTALSDNAIHNKFDAHSVNDPEAKRELMRRIETEFDQYATDSKLLADGFVRLHTGDTWREALVALRANFPGQYFSPVWKPSSTR